MFEALMRQPVRHPDGRGRGRVAAGCCVLLLAFAGCGPSITSNLAGSVSGTVSAPGNVGVTGAVITLTRPGFPDRTASSAADGTWGVQNLSEGNWFYDATAPQGFQFVTPVSMETVPIFRGQNSVVDLAVVPVTPR